MSSDPEELAKRQKYYGLAYQESIPNSNALRADIDTRGLAPSGHGHIADLIASYL
jgi:hypothetical protein